MITGKHLIAGRWVGSRLSFRSEPLHTMGREFADGGADEVHQACVAAQNAFPEFADITLQRRQTMLHEIAARMEAIRGDIESLCCDETGLVPERVSGEFTRTVNQLRYFADYIVQGEHLDYRHDEAIPNRSPLPRPDLRMLQRPVGPVGVFGASNFPLAFSVAGGDTAAAFAAGCPVVVKGHPGHPGTSELVANCVDNALSSLGFPAGCFSLIQSSGFESGQALVTHPDIKAVGFTGSLHGGRALYNQCASRPEPIPFYGELGSINPVFILANALTTQAEVLASQWVDSLMFGAGQLCTNPGLLLLPKSADTEKFLAVVRKKLDETGSFDLLSDNIADAYRQGHDRIKHSTITGTLKSANCMRRNVTASVFTTTVGDWLNNDFLAEEVFGPLGIVAIASSDNEMIGLANSLAGQLTCSIHFKEADEQFARQLLKIVEHKAGRIIFNGFPTGVEVSDAMVHGGPYPASTNFGATSVGSLSIRRFQRPVCFQNMPSSLHDALFSNSGADQLSSKKYARAN